MTTHIILSTDPTSCYAKLTRSNRIILVRISSGGDYSKHCAVLNELELPFITVWIEGLPVSTPSSKELLRLSIYSMYVKKPHIKKLKTSSCRASRRLCYNSES